MTIINIWGTVKYVCMLNSWPNAHAVQIKIFITQGGGKTIALVYKDRQNQYKIKLTCSCFIKY